MGRNQPFLPRWTSGWDLISHLPGLGQVWAAVEISQEGGFRHRVGRRWIAHAEHERDGQS